MPEVLLITKNTFIFSELLRFYRNLRIVPEIFSGYSPVYGIYTALREATFRRVLILPGDTPLIKREVVEAFIEFLPPAVLVDYARIHSLFSLLLKDHIIVVEEFLKQGFHRLKDLHETLNSKQIPVSYFGIFDFRFRSFLNLNGKGEYLEAVTG